MHAMALTLVVFTLSAAQDRGDVVPKCSTDAVIGEAGAQKKLSLSGAVLQAQARPPLTNDDVIRMVQAQVSSKIIVTTIDAADVAFDLSPDGLIGLKDAGVPDEVVQAMVARARPRDRNGPVVAVRPQAPEKSDQLAASKDPTFILRNFKTLYVDASGASFFGNEQMKAALGRDKGFGALKISLVDDPAVADVVLDVGYTFAWDYPFSLRHQNTSLVLASGRGSGPFSGPKGATSVAHEVVKILTPYRVVSTGTPKKGL